MLESDDSIKKIARGTGIALIGMGAGLLCNFVVRLIVARYGLQADYGIFALALVVLNVAVTVAALGLARGTTRYIAYYRGKDDVAKVRITMTASIRLSCITSIIIGLAIFFTADTIASRIFHSPELALPLKIFAAGIPFFSLIRLLTAIHRGFDRIEPAVIFEYMMLNIIFLAFLPIIIAVALPFVAVFYAYLAALAITFVVLAVYTVRKLLQRTTATVGKGTQQITRELLLFSLPLMGSAMLGMLIAWTDTLMLGYFKTPEIVGLYNAAHPLAGFISQPLTALLLIYVPVATGLYSRNLMAELRRNYAILTKWLIFLTLPIFLVLFLYPEEVLKLLFGTAYIPAATALRILAVAFIINNLLGPNGATLIAIGHSRLIMWATLATAILNIALNILLIPPLGIVGAAIASAVSVTVVNIVRATMLYSICRVQPLSKNLLKPAIVCVPLAFIIQVITKSFLTPTWWMLVVLFVVYLGIYSLATLFTRSFDREDLTMLLEIEKRSGMNMASLKKILRRFL